jgi:hypothetical protein
MRHIIYIPIIIISLLVVSCSNNEISSEQANRFIKFYGSGIMDEARDLVILSDGSYAICGIDSVAGQGQRAVLAVTDKFGNLKSGFPKYYADGNNSSGANSMVAKGGGTNGFLLVGYVDKPVVDAIPPIGPVTYQRDLFLVRTSLKGDVIWKESFGSGEDESVISATEMYNSGGFILAGYQFKEGKPYIMLMGVTDQGDSIKLGFTNPPSGDNATANFIMNTGDKYLAICTHDKEGFEGTDILVLNFDEELSANPWYMDEGFDEIGQSIIREESDNYLVLGNSENVSGKREILVYRIETAGIETTKSELLATISDPNGDLIARRFVKTGDGRLAIVGTLKVGGNSDIILQFLDSNYKEEERVIFGSAGDQSGSDIKVQGDEGFVLLGTNGSNTGSMISLIRTGSAGEL